jgi:hypothetical protein
MKFIQKRRIELAHLFQMVILFFILFSSYVETNHTTLTKDHSKTLLCASHGISVTVREASEQLSIAPFIKNHILLEKIWLCVEAVRSSELFTNTALQVSSRFYNTFYVLITIHAP